MNEYINTQVNCLFTIYSLQLIHICTYIKRIFQLKSIQASTLRLSVNFFVYFCFLMFSSVSGCWETQQKPNWQRDKNKNQQKKQISNQMQMIWRQVKSTENDSRQRVFCADPLGTLAMLMVCINPAAYHAQRYGLMMSPLDKCENAKARRCVQSKALTAQCRSMEFDGWLNGKGFLHSCVSLEASCKELLLVVTSGWAKCKYPAVLSNSSEYFHEWIDFFIYLFLCGRPLCKSI